MSERFLGELRYTTAPEDYDGFGTQTMAVVGENRKGAKVRLVRIDPRHLTWQTNRYGSGMYCCWTRDQLTEEERIGWFRWYDQSSKTLTPNWYVLLIVKNADPQLRGPASHEEECHPRHRH